jgi:hypothetical protein
MFLFLHYCIKEQLERNVHSGHNKLPAKIFDFNSCVCFQVWESTLASKDGFELERIVSALLNPKWGLSR